MRTLALALTALGFSLGAQAPAPVPVLRSPDEVEWKISGSLPPGAEYHLIYEDPGTHAVQMLVRFPKDYLLAAHSHSHDETILVLKGKLEIEIGDKTTVLKSGAYAMFPAGSTHALKSKGKCELLVSLNGPFDAKGLPSVK